MEIHRLILKCVPRETTFDLQSILRFILLNVWLRSASASYYYCLLWNIFSPHTCYLNSCCFAFLLQKLVVKPDQLIKRRGKLGLVGVNLDLNGVKEWLKPRFMKETVVRHWPFLSPSAISQRITSARLHPFVIAPLRSLISFISPSWSGFFSFLFFFLLCFALLYFVYHPCVTLADFKI